MKKDIKNYQKQKGFQSWNPISFSPTFRTLPTISLLTHSTPFRTIFSRASFCCSRQTKHQLSFIGFMKTLEARLNDQLQSVAEAPPTAVVEPNRYTHRSIETLVFVLAVITIVAVIAGIVARLCGGRHFGRNGEHDIEGWVERKCRSCIDGGVPPAAPPPEEPKPTATEEAKK